MKCIGQIVFILAFNFYVHVLRAVVIIDDCRMVKHISLVVKCNRSSATLKAELARMQRQKECE